MADTPARPAVRRFASVSMQSETYELLLAFKGRLERSLGKKVAIGKVIEYLLLLAQEKDEDLPKRGPC